MLPQVMKVKGIALDLFFPRRCVGCGKEGAFLCVPCCQTLARIEPPICPRCGRPQPEEVICAECKGWQTTLAGIRSPFVFEGTMRKAIHQFKYSNLKSLAEPLAGLLHDYLEKNPLPVEVLVPLPLHRRRLRERGYNQSELLARGLSQAGSLPVLTDCLLRRQYTLPQARTTSVVERRNNVTDAFVCRDNRVRDKRVLLIDDVATSGATLDAAAIALKDAGAASVWGLVVAREI